MSRLEETLTGKNGNYILPFFWQHGEDEATLREYMQVIHDANIGAVCVESRPHPDFVGEKWWMDMDVILEEAGRLNMKVWILDDSHFPTGYANGAVRKAPKELHHKYLCYRTLEMAGPVHQVEFEVKHYMQPAPPPPWIPAPPKTEDDFEDDELVGIYACPVLDGGELGEPSELTGQIQDGKIVFDLPEGYFKLYVVYITRNGRGRKDYINFMDEESCRLLIDAVYEPHYEHYGKYFGNVIAGFFSDEPPVGNVDGYQPTGPVGEPGRDLPWSRAAGEKFTEAFGCVDWKRLTPYLWADAVDKESQARVRNAYMEMVTRLEQSCFSEQIGKWCENHGVEYIGHMLEDCDMNMSLGASMGHFFRGLQGQHMAGIDNIGGQVMIGGQDCMRHDSPTCEDEAGFYQYVLGKLGASHAAIDSKKKGRTMCENLGAYGWQSSPAEQKYLIDHFMVRGINRFVPHAFSPAPFPDPDCPPHFYAHGENPTFRAFGELMAYTNRVCHLIDGGVPHPDVAVLYAAESVWAGDGGSNIPVCRSLSRAQVDFHILPADIFAEDGEYPMSFDGKKLTVNGVDYRALIVSGCAFVEKKTAQFIQGAAACGYPVLFADRKPEWVIAGTAEENGCFKEALQRCALVPAKEIGSYIREQQIISFQTSAEPVCRMLTSYHYELPEHDEFLILNESSGSTYTGELKLKASGIPVKYDPWGNRVERIHFSETKVEMNVKSETDATENYTNVTVSIQPLELCVIYFLKDKAELERLEEAGMISRSRTAAAYTEKTQTIRTFTVGRVSSGEYLAQLKTSGMGLYKENAAVQTQKLMEIHAPFTGMQGWFPDYSGYYLYETQVSLTPGRAYQIQMEEVHETAEVFLNGRSLGMKIQNPYFFAVPTELVQEENILRIETATLAERKVKAMGVNIAPMSAERPLSPTGIVGEVRIVEEANDDELEN
ncbi:MAG: hypothetical protein LIO94_09930 [Clostridiales bacterium]|nr:hypothetical protein [Clostridiales bacterium]